MGLGLQKALKFKSELTLNDLLHLDGSTAASQPESQYFSIVGLRDLERH
jgi:hypothetical protein